MDRLLNYFQEQNPENCWLWTGPIDAEGYGWLKIDNVVYKAHRLVYEYYTGERIKVSCHRCPGKNNKHCVNPNHIHNGTKKDNRHDQIRYGEDVRLKIPQEDIPLIRDAFKARSCSVKEFCLALAKKYSCSWKTIEGICYGCDRKVQYDQIKNI